MSLIYWWRGRWSTRSSKVRRRSLFAIAAPGEPGTDAHPGVWDAHPMWREMMTKIAAEVEFGAPADEAAVEAAENALGQTLPMELSDLLRECNGVRGPDGLDVIWSAERIAQDNTALRSADDLAQLYMPFQPLVFFGDNGGGDQFAFVRSPQRDEIFVWDHETDSRYLVAYRLDQYIERALRATEDWYR
ncbi:MULTISPECIES: SMI1/KNR4 family protein [unclassified Streptomyces]|uniref:SMI1/KNR4 family protein n=1 Tax=Streptomyces sp. NPDC058812 TaxID=3346639 RepID=UPI0036B40112